MSGCLAPSTRSRSARGGVAGKPPISLDVEILGEVSRVDPVVEVLENHCDFEEEEFLKPQAGPRAELRTLGAFGHSQPLSPRQRSDRLNTWKKEREAQHC